MVVPLEAELTDILGNVQHWEVGLDLLLICATVVILSMFTMIWVFLTYLVKILSHLRWYEDPALIISKILLSSGNLSMLSKSYWTHLSWSKSPVFSIRYFFHSSILGSLSTILSRPWFVDSRIKTARSPCSLAGLWHSAFVDGNYEAELVPLLLCKLSVSRWDLKGPELL